MIRAIDYTFRFDLDASIARTCRLIGFSNTTDLLIQTDRSIDFRLPHLDPIRVRIEVLKRMKSITDTSTGFVQIAVVILHLIND